MLYFFFFSLSFDLTAFYSIEVLNVCVCLHLLFFSSVVSGFGASLGKAFLPPRFFLSVFFDDFIGYI